MNTGIERRPFKLLRLPEHSTAMVIARYSMRQPVVLPGAPTEPPNIWWLAVRVGLLFAACAFAFLVVSQRNVFQRSGEKLGPITESIQRVHLTNPRPVYTAAVPVAAAVPAPAADAKTISQPETDVPSFDLPNDKNLNVTEFSLLVSPEFQKLGAVQLRLNSIAASGDTYDITVRTKDREFYRQDVKPGEPIAVNRNSRNSPQIVVGAIGHNQVFGYLSEPQHRGRHRHRRHS